MGADTKVQPKIDSFLGEDKIKPIFPSIPEKIRRDSNQTISSHIEEFKNSFVNFNIIGGNFGDLKIDVINSDLKLVDIPETISSNIDFNPKNKKYYKSGKLILKFKGSFKELKIDYSIIRKKENELEITFYSLEKNKKIKEYTNLNIERQEGIKEYNINFKEFYGDQLQNKDLNLKINIDWSNIS